MAPPVAHAANVKFPGLDALIGLGAGRADRGLTKEQSIFFKCRNHNRAPTGSAHTYCPGTDRRHPPAEGPRRTLWIHRPCTAPAHPPRSGRPATYRTITSFRSSRCLAARQCVLLPLGRNAPNSAHHQCLAARSGHHIAGTIDLVKFQRVSANNSQLSQRRELKSS